MARSTTSAGPALGTSRVAALLGGLGLGAIGGVVASMLRRRPPTIFADGLRTADPVHPGRGQLPESGQRRR